MSWTPASTDLGSVNENVNISHSFTYVDPVTMVSYPVTVSANEVNPPTIVISGNSISGFYIDSFENTITYRTEDGQFPVVEKFSEIDLNALYEMISYKASTVLTKTFTYTAEAIDGGSVVASQTYTKTVTNDWTEGKNSLQTFVGLTNASS
jgi:hypothetical protein